MTHQEINIEIAKACGWMDIYRCGRSLKKTEQGVKEGKYYAGTKDPPTINYCREYEKIPNYCKDLNAINQAVNEFFGYFSEEWMQYEKVLREVVHKELRLPIYLNAATAMATAEQRAIAFIEAKKKLNL